MLPGTWVPITAALGTAPLDRGKVYDISFSIPVDLFPEYLPETGHVSHDLPDTPVKVIAARANANVVNGHRGLILTVQPLQVDASGAYYDPTAFIQPVGFVVGTLAATLLVSSLVIAALVLIDTIEDQSHAWTAYAKEIRENPVNPLNFPLYLAAGAGLWFGWPYIKKAARAVGVKL